MKLRKEVKWFAEQMETKLSSKDKEHPTGWTNDDLYSLYNKLEDKLHQLGNVDTSETEIIHQLSVDISNYAMMIADINSKNNKL
jgi:hypothetical protein